MSRSNEEEIKPGDLVIFPSRYSTSHGPFRVCSIKRGVVRVERRSRRGKIWHDFFTPSMLVKLKPGQSVQQALRAVVPANQLCEICEWRPAPESHFITVPVPKAFYRVCVGCKTKIKKRIRERVRDIVAEVFEEAKRSATKEARHSEA